MLVFRGQVVVFGDIIVESRNRVVQPSSLKCPSKQVQIYLRIDEIRFWGFVIQIDEAPSVCRSVNIVAKFGVVAIAKSSVRLVSTQTVSGSINRRSSDQVTPY